ncbi:hypothetical protein K4573_000070 [Escherichia coli]|nr:hypothetical protein [Escherichia coli]
MIKKTTEIDAILLNLNKAIDAHYQWLVSMFHSVVNTNLSMQAFTAGLLAVFFRRHKNQAPCTQL